MLASARVIRHLRLVLALCALALPATVLAACGGGVPGNAVAQVGDSSVTQTDFQHWLRIAAISSQAQTPGATPGQVAVPDPPAFTKCIAQKRATAPKPAKGQPSPTDAQFRAECQQQYAGLRDQVAQFLITADWFNGEASDRGLQVTDQQVAKRYQQTKKQQWPTPQAFAQFLQRSGYTPADIMFRIRLGLLQDALRKDIIKGKGKVSPAQVSSYYAQHKQQFGQPERRDLQLILTKSPGAAAAAKKALAGGAKFADVAKRFSVDPQTKSQGGVLAGATQQGGQLEPQLARAAFTAPLNQLQGPLKTQFGFYVFQVSKVTPASQQSLAQATPSIRQILINQNQQKALDAFIKGFRKKWVDKTVCRAGFINQDCKNAPKPKAGASTTSSTPTTG